jgi:O-antigen ligase
MPDAWGCISLTPAASAATARRLLLGVATIFAVADIASQPNRRRWLYTSLALAGAAVWATAFIFPIDTDSPKVLGFYSLRGPIEYWKTYDRPPAQTAGYAFLDWVPVGSHRYQADGALLGNGCGPYIYSNHFANALCLTVPAICGLLAISLRKRIPSPLVLPCALAVFAAAAATSWKLAGSRAGTAAIGFAAIVFLTLATQIRSLRWATGALACGGVALLLGLVAVFQGPAQGVLAFLPEPGRAAAEPWLSDARMVAARMAGRMFLASPVLGTGLGSYGDLFPSFTASDRVMYFAHNDYAQLLAEGGLIGAAIAGTGTLTLCRRLYRFLLTRDPSKRVVDAGVWAATAGGLAHSVFDWNMHSPANSFIACLTLGLALSSTGTLLALTRPMRWTHTRLALTGMFLAASLSCLALLGRDAITEEAVGGLRRAVTAARLAETAPDLHDSALAGLKRSIQWADRVTTVASKDWQIWAALCQAHLHQAFADRSVTTDAVSRQAVLDRCFRRARLASPAARGLPESMPNTSIKESRE